MDLSDLKHLQRRGARGRHHARRGTAASRPVQRHHPDQAARGRYRRRRCSSARANAFICHPRARCCSATPTGCWRWPTRRAHAVQDPRPRGLFRLGAMESTAAVRLPGPLSEYHRRYPEVVLELRTGNPPALAAAILAGELDAALVTAPYAEAPFEKIAVFEEEPVIVSSAGTAGVGQERECPAYHPCLRTWLPASQAAGGLVRTARRDAGAHHRAWVLPCHARMRGCRNGCGAAAQKRVDDLSREQAAQNPSATARPEPRGDTSDLAKRRGFAKGAGAV